MRLILLSMFFLPFALGCTAQPSGTARYTFDLQGHRGARGLLPENTIPAFLRALELGVTTLELDAVIAGDSTVVVSHEPWMSGLICTRPDGQPVALAEEREHRIFGMTYAEVAAYDCGSRGNARFPTQEPVAVVKPRLRSVIEAAEQYAREHDRPLPRYNIETKAKPEWDGTFTPSPETFTRLLYDVMIETGVKDRMTLQSFDVRTLQAARRLDPDLRLVLLIEEDEDQGLAANLDRLGFTPSVYSPNYHLVDAELVEAAHERGMQVIPWTVNTVEEMRRLLDLGVDGIITDYPDRGATLLR